MSKKNPNHRLHIVAVDTNRQCWGRGETLDEADAKLRRNGGQPTKKTIRVVVVWDASGSDDPQEGPYIDGFGQLYAPGPIICERRISGPAREED